VKFLIDNQLPAALAQYLRDRGCDCQHVREAGPGDALDTKYAGTPKIKVTSLSARMKIFSTSPNGPARKTEAREGKGGLKSAPTEDTSAGYSARRRL